MLNSVVLVGRLTRDPELRSTTNGTPVVSFTLACDDSFRRGPNGERSTVFMNCSLFGNRADNVSKFVRKGSLVGVTGHLTQRKYTNKAGVEITVTEIRCDNVEFMEPKGSRAPASDNAFTQNVSEPQPQGGALDSLDEFDPSSEDLPF